MSLRDRREDRRRHKAKRRARRDGGLGNANPHGNAYQRTKWESYWRGQLSDYETRRNEGVPETHLNDVWTLDYINDALAQLGLGSPEKPHNASIASRSTVAASHMYSGNVIDDSAMQLMTSLALGGTISTSPLGVSANARIHAVLRGDT